MKQLKARQRGFTLIEIMVVVVILGILAAIVVPKLMSRPEQARIVKARQDVLAIQSALQLYKLDNGFYPSNAQGIQALVKKPSSEPVPMNWNGYLEKMPLDPWGKAYHYKNPGDHRDVDVYSNGPPDAQGTESVIGNWSN